MIERERERERERGELRQYCSTIAKYFAISNADKACLLRFDDKISQHMQYRSANVNV